MKTRKSSIANAELSNQQLHARIDQLSEQIDELEHLSSSKNDKLYALSAALKLGFWEWDEITGRATYYSQEMASIFGVSLDELKSRFDNLENFYDCVHPDDLEGYIKNNQINTLEINQTNRAHSFEYRIIWPNGEVRQLCEL